MVTARVDMAIKASETVEKPSNIYSQCIMALNNNANKYLKDENNIKRTIRNYRKAPLDVNNLGDLIIPQEYAYMRNSPFIKSFLLYDNGVEYVKDINILNPDVTQNPCRL